ncbi:MAG: hypothetical protein NVS1B11_36930 [Terriglobales bacterium]
MKKLCECGHIIGDHGIGGVCYAFGRHPCHCAHYIEATDSQMTIDERTADQDLLEAMNADARAAEAKDKL